MSVYLEIKKCNECPHVKPKDIPSSVEGSFDYFCSKSKDKKITKHQIPKPPKWCPLQNNNALLQELERIRKLHERLVNDVKEDDFDPSLNHAVQIQLNCIIESLKKMKCEENG